MSDRLDEIAARLYTLDISTAARWIESQEERISELEEALSMCHHYAYDNSHGLDDDDALDRIRAIAYRALERPR